MNKLSVSLCFCCFRVLCVLVLFSSFLVSWVSVFENSCYVFQFSFDHLSLCLSSLLPQYFSISVSHLLPLPTSSAACSYFTSFELFSQSPLTTSACYCTGLPVVTCLDVPYMVLLCKFYCPASTLFWFLLLNCF